jgi:methionyl-tRNA formyltransferase
MKKPGIVFMGTPEFAVATLSSLLENDFNIVSVVTAAEKPSGRGRRPGKLPVRIFAESNNLPVLQPENLKDPEFISALKEFEADIFIVVAFRMLPEAVWKIPPRGTINLHASLLPHYRGAAPINHVLINGEAITGVTTFLIDDNIDTGKILLREEIPVDPLENAGELHDRLMKRGAALVLKTLRAMSEDQIIPQPQSAFLRPGEIPKTAPKIFPGHCIINWQNECHVIHNFIRGLSPGPGARSFLLQDEKTLSFKIFECLPEIAAHKLIPGSVVSDGKTYMKIACPDGFVNIASLQLEGRKKMNTTEFLKGFKLPDHPMAVTLKASPSSAR